MSRDNLPDVLGSFRVIEKGISLTDTFYYSNLLQQELVPEDLYNLQIHIFQALGQITFSDSESFYLHMNSILYWMILLRDPEV